MDELKPKVSIIGCGNVGMRYAYAAIIKGLARQIVLVDINRKRAESEVLDLCHGAPFYPPVEISAGDYPDIKDSSLVVVTAGKNIVPGQTRLDIAKTNSELFKKIIPEIVKHAPGAVILVVSNPVDILSYAAYKISGKPSSEVIGSGTVLDSARLRFLLGRHCRIDTRNIHAYILGEHGDSEFPCWSKAMVGGVSLSEYCSVCCRRDSCKKEELLEGIFSDVKNAAYQIIQGKGETSYGIGMALARITQAIFRDENAVLPISCLVNGFLGMRDFYTSLPAVVNKNGAREVLSLNLSEKEKELFISSASAVKNVLKQIGF